MKLRYYPLVSVLMVMIPISAEARCTDCREGVEKCLGTSTSVLCREVSPHDTEIPAPLAAALPSPLNVKDEVISTAYKDVFGILSGSNTCSMFFGGPRKSLTVLNGLVGQLKKEYLPSQVGIELSGMTENVDDRPSGASYRLFQRMVVNSNGPFYKRKTFSAEPTVIGIGSFMANSREARALMLLHEMAHLMKGNGGTWLIPDDGGNGGRSEQNTRLIESSCGTQIKGLKSADSAHQIIEEVRK